MDTQLFTNYLKDLQAVLNRNDGREESFYPALARLVEAYAQARLAKNAAVTILPKATTAGNPDKYFEGITPEVWSFHIGGYQVMHKYLKDRKGKTLADPIHYCRIATALAHTIRLQTQIDPLYKQVDEEREK